MRLAIRNAQDFWCGMFFVALGALAIWLARDYQMGDALNMGPGYFPVWLGAILMLLGIAIVAAGLRLPQREAQREELRDWAFRPWLVLPGTFAVYAFLMDAEVGFVPSLLVLISGCAFAHRDVRWRETLLLSVFVTAAAVAIFSYGIGMPYRLFWWSE